MLVHEILDTKGHAVSTIGPDATLAEVANSFVKFKIGSLLICRHDEKGEMQLLGIVTERDILYQFASAPEHSAHVPVCDIMTKEILSASPDDNVDELFGVFTTKRIRHLPVLRDGRLIGIVSIGDIVKAQHDRLAMENRFMKDYIAS
jgi:CBS domain-containing protein